MEPFVGQLLGPLALTAGLILVLAGKLQGWWFTRAEMRRELRRADRQEQRGDRLVVALLKLQGATDAMVEAVKAGQFPPEESTSEWP
jgi:uncharacterized protein with ACT and thioredoxin-like domain